jgi:hypothetical protein
VRLQEGREPAFSQLSAPNGEHLRRLAFIFCMGTFALTVERNPPNASFDDCPVSAPICPSVEAHFHLVSDLQVFAVAAKKA